MNDLQKVFDVGQLTDHQLGCVEYVLNSPAYLDVFQPYLQGMRNRLNQMLLDRSQLRKAEFSDDYLAGNIVAIDGLLKLFEKLVTETRMERMVETQASLGASEQYDTAQQEGRHDPILGANEPVYEPAPRDPGGALNSGVPPEEDF